MSFKKFSAVAFAAAICSISYAAQIGVNEYKSLANSVNSDGSVHVVANLFVPTLDEIYKNQPQLKEKTEKLASTLYAELADSALPGGRWSNSVGQIGFYVNAVGLKKLSDTSNALSVWAGASWIGGTHVSDNDGSLTDLDNFYKSNALAEVVVTLNVDDLQFKVGKDGAAITTNSAQNIENANRLATDLLVKSDALRASPMSLEKRLLSDNIADSNSIVVRVSKNELIELSRSRSVRALKRKSYAVNRKPVVNAAEFSKFRNEPIAVGLVLTNPLEAGALSLKNNNNLRESNRQLVRELATQYGFKSKSQDLLENLGILFVELTGNEIDAMVKNGDPRIKSIFPVKEAAKPALTQSVPMINAHTWHGYGYTGAGQNIVIIDTGVEKDHSFLKNSAGASRVILEFCFGTTGVINGSTHSTLCPAADPITGDSPDNYPGSASPLLDHGTHVAGIAAGWSTDMKGVAPGANIVAVRPMSTRNGNIEFINKDIYTALDRLAILAEQQAPAPYTVNMSLENSWNVSTTGWQCEWEQIGMTQAVSRLKSAGVPVVAATGNGGLRYAINWPACIDGVIKVSSVESDGIGLTASNFANRYDPATAFGGQSLFFAPGGNIYSSVPGNQFTSKPGTSMATPHVAGIYALLKAALPTHSVDQLSALIKGAAKDFTAEVCPPNVVSGGTGCYQAAQKRVFIQ